MTWITVTPDLIAEFSSTYNVPDLPPAIGARIARLDTISAWGLIFRLAARDKRLYRARKTTTERDRRRLRELTHAALNATEEVRR